MSENGVELKVGNTLFVTEDGLTKGLQEVVITRTHDKSPSIFWADNHGYEYLNSLGSSDGCLLRALYLGSNAFRDKEAAKSKLKKIYADKIKSLLSSLVDI